MKMFYLNLNCILFLLMFSNAFSQNKTDKYQFLIVEKYETSSNLLNKNKILERRFYDGNKNLTKLILIDPKKNTTDSIVLFYNDKNVLTKQLEYSFNAKKIINESNTINYIYNNEGELVDLKNELKIPIKYNPKYLTCKFNDTLKLLENELSDINTVIDNANAEPNISTIEEKGIGKVTKEHYTVNFRMTDISRYGIPINSVLESMNLYYKNDLTLVKDEFVFDQVKMTREYYYSKKTISKIKIELKFKNLHKTKIEYAFLYPASPSIR